MEVMTIIFLLFLLALINNGFSVADLKHFLARKTTIENNQDLEAFKRLVRKQMIQALFQIVCLGGMGIVGVVGILNNRLRLSQILLFLLLNGVIFILCVLTKKIEEKIRSFTIENDDLAKAYKFFCEYWVRKPFPNF